VSPAAGAALFSAGWFEGVAALAAGADLPAVARAPLGVEYHCLVPGGVVTHHQRFAGGRLEAWGRGPLPGAQLRLRQTLRAHLALLTRRGLGDVVLRESAVEVPGPDGPRLLPPPPLDEVLLDWGGGLPAIRTVPTFTVQQVLVDSPFGAVATWHRLEQARVVESGVGTVRADVIAKRRYADGLAERDGALDVLESIVRGEIGGDIKLLSMFLGIYDDDACKRARRGLSTPAMRPLALLGELLSSPGWAPVAEGLAAALAATPGADAAAGPPAVDRAAGQAVPAAGQARTQADPDV
jgi:hypothetical protein